MSSIPYQYRFPAWKAELEQDRDFYIIFLIFLILGLILLWLLATREFLSEDPFEDIPRYAEIKIGGLPMKELGLQGGMGNSGIGEGGDRGQGRGSGRKGAMSKGAQGDLFERSLLGVISTRARGGNSALGRMLQKGGLGTNVDQYLGKLQKGTGTGSGTGGGIGGGEGWGRSRGQGAGELGDGSGAGLTGIGEVGTGYGSGGDNIDLGIKQTHKVYATLSRGEASIEGSLDPTVIEGVVRDNLAGLKYCYEKELNRNPKLAGKITIQWTIGLAGTVTEVVVENSSMNHPLTEDCLLRRIRRWRFPKPMGGDVAVSYPFVFSPSQ